MEFIKSPIRLRPFWLMVKVIDFIMDSDSNIRSMKLKQPNGAIVHHSISNLYPLELSITHEAKAPPNVNEVEDESSKTDALIVNQEVSRRKRKAALTFNQFLKEYRKS